MNTVRIKTNPATDYLMGRNGRSKLEAIQILDGQGAAFIDGINSTGFVTANSGFSFEKNPRVLRQLSEAFATLANETERSFQTST